MPLNETEMAAVEAALVAQELNTRHIDQLLSVLMAEQEAFQQEVTTKMAEIRTRMEAIRATYPPPAPTETVVRAGGDINAALRLGLPVRLEEANYQQAVVIPTGGVLTGTAGTRIVAIGAPAVRVAPGSSRVRMTNFEVAASNYTGTLIRLGDNSASTQGTPDAEPFDIVMRDIRAPLHRGQRTLEINARDVEVLNYQSLDNYMVGTDSQAVCVLNSSGNITLRGGRWCGGAQAFLQGGDTVKMRGADGQLIVPTNTLIDGVEMFRPTEWYSDGINHGVKNLWEIKNGINMTVQNCAMHGNWNNAQDGEALLVTPTRGGIIRNCQILSNVVYDSGGAFELTGRSYSSYSAEGTTVIIADNRIRVARNAWRNPFTGSGCTGQFIKFGNEMWGLTVERNRFYGDGSSLIYGFRGTVMEQDGTTHAGGNVRLFAVRDNYLQNGQYGINLDGYANGGVEGQGLLMLNAGWDVSGNVFGGDSSTSVARRNFPNNTYETLAQLQARPEMTGW